MLLLLFSIVSSVVLESLVEAVLDPFQSWLEAYAFAPACLLAEDWVWSSSSSVLAVPHPLLLASSFVGSSLGSLLLIGTVA